MIPTSTYRVQLRNGVGFDQVAGWLDRLAALGVSHLYLSPVARAVPGSSHGYDVVDPGAVDETLGGRDGLARLAEAARARGMGLIVDIVPNHVAIGHPDNLWWWDVLTNGPSSRYAGYFDVDWRGGEPDTVLVPVLGDHYGAVLANGEIELVRLQGWFRVAYHEHRFPVAPRAGAPLVATAAESLGGDDGQILGLLAEDLAELPRPGVTDREARERRHRRYQALRGALHRMAERPEVAAALDEAVAGVNRDPDRLHALLDRQPYRLAWWRRSARDLEYRRFFDVDTLAGVRVEDPEVFAAVHQLPVELVVEGLVDGLRLDHPDGLADPVAHARRLREAVGPDAWLVAEKITEGDETLPAAMPLAGTTGYDTMADVDRLFVEPAGHARLEAAFVDRTGDQSWASVLEAAKRQVLDQILPAELNRLVESVVEVCDRHRDLRDHWRSDLEAAVVEMLVAFDVYRTYVGVDQVVTETDRAVIERAAERVRAAGSVPDGPLEVVVRILGADPELEAVGGRRARLLFQQVSGPVMAKGAEDTAMYRWYPLASVGEVGADPGHPCDEDRHLFWSRCRVRAERWPTTMTALSTHDTKRSSDMRARLAVLSEPELGWPAIADRLDELARPHLVEHLPDARTRWLLWQTLIGVSEPDRIVDYLTKAMREAKLVTRWAAVDEGYEAATVAGVRALLAAPAIAGLVDEVRSRVIEPGRINALAKLALTLTAPGVPDIYQGDELWNLTLVDPDNRRPLDHEGRLEAARSLEQLGRVPPPDGDPAEPGLAKLGLITALLGLRRRQGLTSASFEPLAGEGAQSRHLVGFARGERVITLVPRYPVGLAAAGGWGETAVELGEGSWVDVVTGAVWAGGRRLMAELTADFPVAVLERQG